MSCRQSLFNHRLQRNISNRQDAVVILFLCAHLFFIMADKRFRAAGLMGFRLGADFPCQIAQRFFIASEMRLRPAAPIPRGFLPGAGATRLALGGRPLRAEEREASRSSAEMACSIRLRSALRSETKIWKSIESFPSGLPSIVAVGP